MIAPPWLLLRLALETSVHHAPADEDRLAGIGVATVEEYRDFIARIFGFEAAVERAIARVGGLDVRLVKQHSRAPLICEDLRAMGVADVELSALPTATNVRIESVPHALGWMFVLERQTLLSGLLLRQIQLVLGDRVASATRYLGAYGSTPGACHRAFGEKLGRLAQTHSAILMAAGANDAFRAQRQWYQGRPPRSESTAPATAPVMLSYSSST